MLKPRKFDIADSNIANLGSDLEKKVSFLLFFFLFFFFFFFSFFSDGISRVDFFLLLSFSSFLSFLSFFSSTNQEKKRKEKKRKESNRDLIWGDQEERCSPLGDSFFFILEFGEFLTLLV